MNFNYKPKIVKLRYEETKLAKGRTEVSQSGFYDSPEWRKLRRLKLANNPICEHCKKNKRYRKAVLVDHITPLNLNNVIEYGLAYWNLQSLCHKCHVIKTSRCKGKYDPENLEKGKKLQNKLNQF